MKQTITVSQFRDAFRDIRPDNFSYQGLGVLYDWLEELADDTGHEVELDVIGLCCEFSESTLDEVIEYYDIHTAMSGNIIGNTALADQLIEQAAIDYLNDHTLVVGLTSNGSIIYQDF